MERKPLTMEATLIKSEYEIERGKPIPSRNHAYIQSKMIKLLDRKYDETYEAISELSILLDGKEVVPDVLIYKKFDFRPGNDEIKVSELPLNVIEILSPSQNLSDLIIKSYKYFDSGIQSYWLIIPDLTTIYVFSAPDEFEVFVKKEKLVDAKLGIELELGAIFS
jgi:Uma2 family endonuclease